MTLRDIGDRLHSAISGIAYDLDRAPDISVFDWPLYLVAIVGLPALAILVWVLKAFEGISVVIGKRLRWLNKYLLIWIVTAGFTAPMLVDVQTVNSEANGWQWLKVFAVATFVCLIASLWFKHRRR